jgi:putative oxygen-independent coproporphyrinogen III oxidase
MKSVYIHIPFCENICSYCDFCKFFYNEKMVNQYLTELNKEIKNAYGNEIIETVYIGGGTPSSLNIEQLRTLFEMIKIIKTNNLEYTIECNIESITEEKLKLFKKYGVNRLSIGIQTFNEKNLKYLNRKHTKKEVFEKISLVKQYFDNINVDLIYAIPGETVDDLIKDLNNFIELDVSHISTYSLIIEDHTILKNNGFQNIEEEIDLRMYEIICDKLKDFEHYEISNFGKIKSRHNLTYWNNEEYYGFGLGASGYVNNVRYDNTKSFNSYLKGNYRINEEYQTNKQKIENEFILGLRKIKGIDINLFNEKYKQNIKNINGVNKLISEKKLILEGDCLFINSIYLYTSNDILLNFID